MGTVIRPELSSKNKYWISKHRYYELKHFCLQYGECVSQYIRLGDSIESRGCIFSGNKNTTNEVSDPTFEKAEELHSYAFRIGIIEKAANDTDPVIGRYILKGVTKGLSYDVLKVNDNIPCGKELYYQLYRRFFWLLDKSRR